MPRRCETCEFFFGAPGDVAHGLGFGFAYPEETAIEIVFTPRAATLQH